MKMLLALYPRGWRRRYAAEFAAVLDEQRPSAGLVIDVVLGAIDAHLDPQVADDGEESRRRRMKGVVMDGLKSRRVLMAIGLALPFLGLGLSYLSYDVRHGGVALPMAIALASGLLVGRWWAPFPFIGICVIATLVFFRGSVTGDASGWFTQLAIAWTGFCLIGAAVRALLARDLAHLREQQPDVLTPAK